MILDQTVTCSNVEYTVHCKGDDRVNISIGGVTTVVPMTTWDYIKNEVLKNYEELLSNFKDTRRGEDAVFISAFLTIVCTITGDDIPYEGDVEIIRQRLCAYEDAA